MSTDLYAALLHAAALADRFEAEHGRPLTNADVLLAAALVEHGAPDADVRTPAKVEQRDSDVSETVDTHDDDAPAGCDVPPCPTCGGPQWDNRPRKLAGSYKSNAPDTRCKDRGCDGCVWKLKVKHLAGHAPAVAATVPGPFDHDDDDLPF